MSRWIGWMAGLWLATLGLARAQDDAERKALAAEVVDALNLKGNFEATLATLADMQEHRVREQAAAAGPAGEAQAPAALTALRRELSWETVQPDLVKVYAELFTVEELKDIAAFFKRPAGRRLTGLVPELNQRAAQILQARLAGLEDRFEEDLRMARMQADVRTGPVEPPAETPAAPPESAEPSAPAAPPADHVKPQ